MPNSAVYIGLGSNLGDSIGHLVAAIVAIDNLDHTRVEKTSSFYQSKPMGPQDQPLYINAVLQLTTRMSADDLLTSLQKIEMSLGRVRDGQRWGPRTVDLDILLFGDQHINTETLTVPHYGMAEREFVLVPLFEIAPNLVMPDGHPLSVWVARCSLDGLKRLPSSNPA